MRAFLVIATTVFLTACGSVAHKVASGVDNAQLKNTVGKPYADVIYQHPYFGKLIGRERLQSGDEIMKHVGEFGKSTSDMVGLYGKQRQNMRALYFLVDTQGVIKDWASEFYEAGSASCWVGICGGSTNEQVPLEELDKLVKTSSGGSVAAWHTTN
jgi:hypothetical protein